MNVRELINLLVQFPDDMKIVATIESGQAVSGSVIELRDLLDRDTKQVIATVLQIRHENYGRPIGFRHLCAEELATVRFEILDGLADVERPEKWATRRFTGVHGDHRIYHHSGGDNDTCYGTPYDPRVFADLAAEGLIRVEPQDRPPLSGIPSYRITKAGKAVLARGIEAL